MIQFFKKNIFLKNNTKRKTRDFFLIYTLTLIVILTGIVVFNFGFLLRNINIVLEPGKPRPEDIPSFNLTEFEKIQKEW